MRLPFQRLMPGTRWLAAACLACFAAQAIAARTPLAEGVSFGNVFSLSFGIHAPLLFEGFFWQPVTYMFLHASFAHLALNLLGLTVFGRDLEPAIGTRRFVMIFVAGGIVGGLGWLAADLATPWLVQWLRGMPAHWLAAAGEWIAARGGHHGGAGLCVGASAGVCGLAGTLAMLARRRWFGWLIVTLTLGEPMFRNADIAHAAHIFGCFAGIVAGARIRAAAMRRASTPPRC